MKKVVSSILVFMLAFAMVGCSGSDKKDEEKKTEFAVGEVALIDDIEYTVTNVNKHQGDNQFLKPEDGKEFVTVTIKIENKSDKKASYNALDWKMVNSSGQENTYDLTATSGGELNSGDLTAGGVIEGTISFEEPAGDTGLKLNLYSNAFSDDIEATFILQ